MKCKVCNSLREVSDMDNCYRVIVVSLVCLLLAVPMMAAEIGNIEMLQGEPHPIRAASPLDCCAQTVYDNQGGNFYFTNPEWNLLDDGSFPTGTAPISISCFRFAWHMADTAQLYIFVDFWDTLDPDGPVCNLSYLGGFGVDIGICDAGGWYGDIILGDPIYFPDDTWYVQMSYYESADPWTPSTTGTVLFAGAGPSVGSNDPLVFWLDANGNASFDCPDEEYSLGTDWNAQFFLRLGADVGPSATENSSWGAIKALYR
jgi:hypothetical protein